MDQAADFRVTLSGLFRGVFWVLPAAVLEATGMRSISMPTLDKITNRVSFEDLNIAIHSASEPSTSYGS